MNILFYNQGRKGIGSDLLSAVMGLVLVGATVLLTACGSEAGVPQASTPVGNASTPEAAATAASMASTARAVSSPASQVIVGTAVEASTSAPLRDMPVSTPAPAVVMKADAGGLLVVTSDNANGAAEMKVGDKIQMSLDANYDWSVSAGAGGVLKAVGGDGMVYEAVGVGTSSLEIMGDPKCRKSRPPCGLASKGFTLRVTVR